MTFAQCIQWMKNLGMTVGRITWEGDGNNSLANIVALAQAFRADGTGLKLYVTLDIGTVDGSTGVTWASEALAYAGGAAWGAEVATALAPYTDVVIALATGNEMSGKDSVRLVAAAQGTADSDFNNAKFPALRGVMGGTQDAIKAVIPTMPVFSNAYIFSEINLIQMLWDGRQPDGTSGYRRIIPDGFDLHSYMSWNNPFVEPFDGAGWLPFFNYVEQVYLRFSGKPIYLSEFNGDAGTGDVVQANWVQKRLQDFRNKALDYNIAGYAYYAMIDTSGNVWGCLENSGSLRVTRGQLLARQIRQSPDPAVNPIVLKAFEVMAKYAGNVRLYLPSWAFTDAAATLAANAGVQAYVLPDLQNSADAVQSTVANQPVVTTDANGFMSLSLNGNSPMNIATPQFGTNDDHAVVMGCKASALPGSTGTGPYYGSAKNTSGQFSRMGGISYINSVIRAYWTSDVPTDFWAEWTNAPPATTPLVLTSRRIGSLGTIRGNGVQQGSTSLAGFSITPTCGFIGQQYFGDVAEFSGNIYGIVSVKGTLTDAEVLILEQWMNTLTPTGVVF